MKGSVLIPCTKGFLLFVLLQTSLILYASAQENSTNSTNSTSSETVSPVNVTSLTNQTVNATVTPSGNDTSNGNTGTNGTNSTTVSCRVFSCNYSACYSTFTSTNVTTCSAPENFCELRKDGDATYSVRCTSSCLSACTNSSQNNCSINCCSNNCVNSTLNSLLNSSIIMTTTTTSTTTSTTARSSTVASTTMATNGKKCHKLGCSGDNCYQGNTNVALCAPGQNFCMLKKTLTVTVTTWTAGCIEDCSKETVCTSSNNNCILECCNATTTASCLKLNGQVNIVGSGTTAPSSHVPLVISSFFLWLLIMGKSAD
ncbi:autotransporter adhesin BpaC isoform X2 [Pangasianodon hypophthalmus]|uniref:autotransporter adhesin BpaC isoform X2 n=1 Tax=Pangasianodon hypophthalmus TaxID=310915 RepID=UPI000EFE1F8D|nr:autotransporter adhesin BpaC isoform X2 [Pangasianodon hypophthalmus]